MSSKVTAEQAMEFANLSGDNYPSIEFDDKSLIKIPDNATNLPKDILIDKFLGTIYGNAIGDAVGLATEFMTKAEAGDNYGNGPLEYAKIIQDFHRYRWDKGDWTDDTDQLILILDGILAHGGAVDEIDFAKRLYYWVNHGFPVLGDFAGMGLGMTVSRVVQDPNFTNNPHKIALSVWEGSGKFLAANGATMRTSILGLPEFHNIDKVVENTVKISKVTHADPRCLASSVAVTVAISKMLQGIVNTKQIIDESIQIAIKQFDETNTEQIAEFQRHANANTLNDLRLDENNKIGYTLKCFGSAYYCLRNGTDFRQSITELVMEGGDADTNGAVAGALLGCKLGYKKLPPSWLNNLVNKPFLDAKVSKLFELLCLELPNLHSN